MKTPIRVLFGSLVLAFALSSCCTLGAGASKGRFSELKAQHIAFVDEHTGRPKKWDEAKFNAQVSQITATFDRQARLTLKLRNSGMASRTSN